MPVDIDPDQVRAGIKGVRFDFMGHEVVSVDGERGGPRQIHITWREQRAGLRKRLCWRSQDNRCDDRNERNEPLHDVQVFGWASQPAHAIHDPSGNQVGTTLQFPLTDVTLSYVEDRATDARPWR
jgi:hypothetical protein